MALSQSFNLEIERLGTNDRAPSSFLKFFKSFSQFFKFQLTEGFNAFAPPPLPSPSYLAIPRGVRRHGRRRPAPVRSRVLSLLICFLRYERLVRGKRFRIKAALGHQSISNVVECTLPCKDLHVTCGGIRPHARAYVTTDAADTQREQRRHAARIRNILYMQGTRAREHVPFCRTRFRRLLLVGNLSPPVYESTLVKNTTGRSIKKISSSMLRAV